MDSKRRAGADVGLQKHRSESERLACYDKSARAVKTAGAARTKNHQPPPPELENLLDDAHRVCDLRKSMSCRSS